MTEPVPVKKRPHGGAEQFDAAKVLEAIPQPVIVIDRDSVIRSVNVEAQEFFWAGNSALEGSALVQWLPADSPVFGLIEQARETGNSVAEYGVTIETPRIGWRQVSIQAGPMSDPADMVVLTIQERSIAHKIDKQLTHRHAARSVTGMAAMLAHEVKNPLSGIRGAAQLLEQGASDDDRELTRLICSEADRILGLVERMEVFSDERPIEREGVNIHSVLDHVRKVALTGFARGTSITESYDPSLPPVHGNRDQLIQVFLNLVKNASEAVPDGSGEVVMATSYQHGVRLAVPGSSSRVHLPLLVTIQDNGPGVPEDLQPHLFDPFVTTKRSGSGLGLALVAKIVGDHGGVVELDSRPKRTVVKVYLPMYEDSEVKG